MTPERLIELFGDQAYYKGVELTVQAVRVNKLVTARELAAVTRELMRRGYHKFVKNERHPQAL